MSSLSTLPKGDSAWLLRKAIEQIMEQVSVLETNIGSSTTGNSANTQIIFNDDGTLRGDAGLVYNKTTDALTVAGLVTAGSATITGDLTVDTSTLKVDSTNDNVIVGATSAIGGGRFSVQADLSAKQAICAKNSAASYSATNNFIRFTNSTDATVGGITHPAVTSLGVWGVSDIQFLLSGAGSTAMTLNSTGLGVGLTPSSFGRFSVQGTAGGAGILGMNTDATQCDIQSYNKPLAINRAGNNITLCEGSGNVGVGVSPSVKLDVSGEIKSSGNITSTTGKLAVTGSGQTVGMQIDGFVAGASLDNYILNNSGNAGTIASLSFGRTTSLLYGFLRINNNTQILELGTAATARLSIDQTGNLLVNVPTTAPTLATNSQMVFNLTSNTNLRISVRGTDGTTRTANITLA